MTIQDQSGAVLRPLIQSSYDVLNPLKKTIGGEANSNVLQPSSPTTPNSQLDTVNWSPNTSNGSSREPSPEICDKALTDAFNAYNAGDYNSALYICQALHPSMPNRPDLLLLMGAAQYRLGQYAASIASNDAAILICPTLSEAHANLANALQQLGQIELSIVYYTSSLRLKPGFVDAYSNLAAAYLKMGMLSHADQAYRGALCCNPNLPFVHCGLGDLWRSQNPSAAIECYKTALAIDPDNVQAYRGLGDCYRETEAYDQAIMYYTQAVKLEPNLIEARTGLAMCLKESNRKEEAEHELQLVAAMTPGCAYAVGNLASIYYDNGRIEAAITAYQQALMLQPNFPEALNNLGNALREKSRLDEAIECYKKCIHLQRAALSVSPSTDSTTRELQQRLAVSYNNLAGVLKLQHKTAECIAAYQQVVTLQPSAEAFANAASAYKDAGFHKEAIIAYGQALLLRPDFSEAFANQLHSKQCICDWEGRDEALAVLEAVVVAELKQGTKLPSVQPFHALAYPFSADLAKAISVRYAEYSLRAAKRLKLPKLAHPDATPLDTLLSNKQRLRIGYVSSDFGNHPLSHLMGSVFGLHDRSTIEVYCYALSPDDGSEYRQRIASEAEHFIDVSSWSSADIAQRMSQDGIHIAVNLNGYTKGARNEIFALQPAPVACSFLGFPGSMGAEYIPYAILDKTVCPPENKSAYSECIAYMPGEYSYFVNDYMSANKDVLTGERSMTRADVGLPEDTVVYYCANQLYKYDPETFNTWCNILNRVPNSVLWLLRFPPAGEVNIKNKAALRGIDPNRIIFTNVAAKADHITRSGLADVFLDTPYCNAHTTGCDVLFSGCPIITMPLQRMASRVAASLCAATGLGEHMIVHSHAEYEERAVELGLDHDKRVALKEALCAKRTECALFDSKGWVRGYERVLKEMWAVHCQGNGPRDIVLDDD